MPGVLVIGVDGVRFDALGEQATPSIRELGRTGFLTPVPIDEVTPTWSGPCWATIATGVTVAEHAVLANDFTGHRLADFPDFLTIATRSARSTFLAVSGWPPLATTLDGGPLFAEVTRREFLPLAPAARHDPAAWDENDENVAALAESALSSDRAPDVSFVYFGAVDVTGHERGAGSEYGTAVMTADQRVGRLASAVRARPDGADWTIVVVTDHGHLHGGGHGGREPEVATAWAAAAGPGIKSGARPVISRHTHIAPLVCAAAGVPWRGDVPITNREQRAKGD